MFEILVIFLPDFLDLGLLLLRSLILFLVENFVLRYLYLIKSEFFYQLLLLFEIWDIYFLLRLSLLLLGLLQGLVKPAMCSGVELFIGEIRITIIPLGVSLWVIRTLDYFHFSWLIFFRVKGWYLK